MPAPICIVRRWAMSEPRNTRFEMSDKYSSFFRKSESNRGIRLHRHRLGGSFEDVGDDGIGRHSIGLTLEVQDEAVPQSHRGNGPDVFACDMVTAVEDGAELGCQDDCLGATWTAPVTHELFGQWGGQFVIGVTR